ncbi:MAG: hypothetical protein GX574_06480 [Lentisphaerae bacterium]|nr:hypothetical protein [Lentisphaerota bacterium]HQL87481.1 hypothetical protein [Lentisphaeria bacterium]
MMRQNYPASKTRVLRVLAIPTWPLLAALLFSLALPPVMAESAAVTPADIEQLFKDKQFTQALPTLEAWKKAPPDGLSERQRLLLLGRCLLGLERHSEAMEALSVLQAIAPDAQDNAAVDSVKLLGDALAALGRLDEAAEQWLKAAEMKPAADVATLIQKKASRYFHNRMGLDGVADALLRAHAKVAAAQAAAGNPAGVIAANRRQLSLAVDFPGMREAAVQTAELLLAEKQPREAFALFLRALDTGLDRCFSTTARLPENQRQLNLVAKPPPANLIERALDGINQCLASLTPSAALPPEKVKTLSAAWCQALAATYRPNIGTAAPFIALSKSGLPESWRTLCRWKAANALLREGAFHEARKLLDELPDCGLPTASYFTHRQGMACIGEGDFPAAADFLRAAAGSEDAVLASQARLALAEALEARFNWDNAVGEYKTLASSSPVHWHRQEAAYALKRIAELRQRPPAADRGKLIALLRDDRSTRGCWPLGYGMDFHLLAAQNFITDRKGGAGPAMPCRFRTADPKEKSRLWVTRLRETDPVALWNPHEKSHTSANRDDYGEQYPLGNGPDLLMACDVPAGRHVLALYFANDYNYYESQRAYTVSVTDAGGRLLCLAPVRNFGGGLYKRFAVQGPIRLEFRIWRNMSINVILSGVFLDGIIPPREVPKMLHANPSAPLAAVMDEYRRLRRAAVKESLAVANSPTMADFVQKLSSLSTPPCAASDSRPALLYMLAESQRFAGYARSGSTSFEQMLSALADEAKKDGRPEALASLARQLVSDFAPGNASQQALPQVSLYSFSTHPLLKLWRHYLDVAVDTYRDQPVRLQSLLREKLFSNEDYIFTDVKAIIFEKYLELFPDNAKAWDMLHYAGLLADRRGEYQNALHYYQAALAERPPGLALARVLHDCLALQVKTGSRPEEVRATWDRLAGIEKTPEADQLLKSGKLWLVRSYLNRGECE